jgi:hypothetical protein
MKAGASTYYFGIYRKHMPERRPDVKTFEHAHFNPKQEAQPQT